MPLNLDIENSGGQFYDKLRFNAQGGVWILKNQDGEQRFGEGFDAVFDFPNVETGWSKYNGTYVEFIADPSISERSPAPLSNGDDELWKRAFKVRLFSQKSFNGAVEILGQSQSLLRAFGDLYQKWEQTEKKEGKLPVVSVSGDPEKVGDYYAPNWKIGKLVNTPECFSDREVSEDEF